MSKKIINFYIDDYTLIFSLLNKKGSMFLHTAVVVFKETASFLPWKIVPYGRK